jgi:hypothetical protein
MMLHYGDSRDIWITEFGWSTFQGPNGVDETTQRAYLQRALALLDRWSFVPVATIYTLMDGTDRVPGQEWSDFMGLYDLSHRQKPAATWLQVHRGPKVWLPLAAAP